MASVPKKGINRAGTLSAAINQKNNVVSGNIEDNVRRTRGAVKRKPEGISGNEAKKRTALGNLTNAIGRSTRNITSKIVKKNETKVKGGTSGESDKNIGCLSDNDEDITVGSSSDNEVYSTPLETPIDGSLVKPESSLEAESVPPPGVADFDKENWTDPFCVSIYATDIFENMKKREEMFRVKPYLDIQADLTKSMRVILVDWMVEVQESFEMNHESLYTAVKLVDLFLSKVLIKRDALQLVGATAFLISSKFEERCPPAIDDFLYICDDAYTRREVLKMEINMLKAVDFNLAFPLSYSYLRRYSRCAKLSLETLTLARYILESSLMEYDLIFESESLIAAGSLLLALIMKNNSQWSPTLEYYSGFGLDDLRAITTKLWQMLKQPPKDSIKTIRSKYSHPIFFEVALTPVPLVLEL